MSGSRTIDLRQAFTSNLPTVCNISISTALIHTIPNALSHTLLLSGAPPSAPLMTYFKIISVPSPQLSPTVDIPNTSSVNNWIVPEITLIPTGLPAKLPPLPISHSVPPQPSGPPKAPQTGAPILTAPPETERVFLSCPKIVYRRPPNLNTILTRTGPIPSSPPNLASGIDPVVEPVLFSISV